MPNKEYVKTEVQKIFDRCNFPEYLTGSRALWYCLEYMIDNPNDRYCSLYKKVYDYAAKQTNSTVGAVERCMRTLVENVYADRAEEMEQVLGELKYAGKKRRNAPMIKQVLYRIIALAEKEVLTDE